MNRIEEKGSYFNLNILGFAKLQQLGLSNAEKLPFNIIAKTDKPFIF